MEKGTLAKVIICICIATRQSVEGLGVSSLNECVNFFNLRTLLACIEEVPQDIDANFISVAARSANTSICSLCGGTVVSSLSILDTCVKHKEEQSNYKLNWMNPGFNNTGDIDRPRTNVTLCRYKASIFPYNSSKRAENCIYLTGTNCQNMFLTYLGYNYTCVGNSSDKFTVTFGNCRYFTDISEWSTWSPWTACSHSCQPGHRYRTRNRTFDDLPDPPLKEHGIQTQTIACNTDLCTPKSYMDNTCSRKPTASNECAHEILGEIIKAKKANPGTVNVQSISGPTGQLRINTFKKPGLNVGVIRISKNVEDDEKGGD